MKGLQPEFILNQAVFVPENAQNGQRAASNLSRRQKCTPHGVNHAHFVFRWRSIPGEVVNSATLSMRCQSAVTNNTANTVALVPTITPLSKTTQRHAMLAI